ncbi:MAG TPA: hypothetical protein VH538_07645 [Gaiellaceae bacterium]
MESREARRGSNEAVFRDVNEHIAELGERSRAGTIEILCECSDRTCTEPLSVSTGEYEEARATPTTFIILAGHEDPSVERVVRRRRDHLLVEKLGEAAEAAIAAE